MTDEKRETQVTIQVENLEKSAEDILNLVVELRDRLTPVLKSLVEGENLSDKESSEEIAPLAHSLRSIDFSLLDSRGILQELINRLEI